MGYAETYERIMKTLRDTVPLGRRIDADQMIRIMARVIAEEIDGVHREIEQLRADTHG